MTRLTHRDRAIHLVSNMTLAEKMAQMCYDAPAIERLGVPKYNWWNECLHGVARAGAATVFPQAIAMAASFDSELLEEVATAISDEARAKYNEYKKFGYTEIYQGLTYWSPNINIFRDPRWGRGHETYGEDPYLTGSMGSSFIKGLQGNDEKYYKLDATIKHYVAHSGPEKGRHEFNSKVSKRDLADTYLWAFDYCIKNAKPAAVMGAYNRINGEPCCASETYLKDKLYNEMGFDGYTVSDCGAICDINQHHQVTKNEAESAALAVNNGCMLNCGSAYKFLKAAVASELITEETITHAVETLFEARYRLGMFDEDCPYDKIDYDVIECKKHQTLNLKMAEESIVLLKNDGILPLKEGMSVAVIGPNADDVSVLLGNYNGTPSKTVTLLQGIQEYSKGKVLYAKGCHVHKDEVHEWQEQPLNEAIIAAKRSDVVIMIMGLNPSMEGEEGDAYNGDLGGDKADLELPISQKKLYNEIVKLGKKIIFVNVSGSAINLTKQNEECSAVIQCFYPGAMGGSAFARIIYGYTNPSARLPVTFYHSIHEVPAFEDYSMRNRTYRYYEGEALYAFGYGLSYTEYMYSNLNVNSNDETGMTVEVNVLNKGDIVGTDVVQVYIQYPDTVSQAPRCRLVGFQRVSLDIGEEKSIKIGVPIKNILLANEEGEFYLPKGEYKVIVAPDSRLKGIEMRYIV